MIKSVARIRLIYQIGTVVLLGVFISFFLSMHLLSSERDKNLTSLSSSAAIQRVISIVEILKQSPSSLHASIIQASSSTDLSLSISSTPHITESKNSGDEILALPEQDPQF